MLWKASVQLFFFEALNTTLLCDATSDYIINCTILIFPGYQVLSLNIQWASAFCDIVCKEIGAPQRMKDQPWPQAHCQSGDPDSKTYYIQVLPLKREKASYKERRPITNNMYKTSWDTYHLFIWLTFFHHVLNNVQGAKKTTILPQTNIINIS